MQQSQLARSGCGLVAPLTHNSLVSSTVASRGAPREKHKTVCTVADRALGSVPQHMPYFTTQACSDSDQAWGAGVNDPFREWTLTEGCHVQTRITRTAGRYSLKRDRKWAQLQCELLAQNAQAAVLTKGAGPD